MKIKLIHKGIVKVILVYFLVVFVKCLSYAEKESKTLLFAMPAEVYTSVNKNDAKLAVEMHVAKLAKKMGYTSKIICYKNFTQMVNFFKARKIDGTFVTVTEYYKLNKIIPVEPIGVITPDKNPLEKYFILVNSNSAIKKFSQLKGKKIILKDGLNKDAVKLWINLLIKKTKGKKDTFFKKIIYKNKISQVTLAVYFNKYNACVISDNAYKIMVELNPDIKKKLRIIKISPAFPSGMLCVPKYLNKKVKGDILNQLFKLREDPEGIQMLTLFQIYDVVPFKYKYIKNVEYLLK